MTVSLQIFKHGSFERKGPTFMPPMSPKEPSMDLVDSDTVDVSTQTNQETPILSLKEVMMTRLGIGAILWVWDSRSVANGLKLFVFFDTSFELKLDGNVPSQHLVTTSSSRPRTCEVQMAALVSRHRSVSTCMKKAWSLESESCGANIGFTT